MKYAFLKITRRLMRNIYFIRLSFFDVVLRRKNTFSYPQGKTFVGAGDFKKIGQEFLWYFIRYSKLKPSAKVLDVGCGLGRMAIPLTKFLNKKGNYEGFDIVPSAISWCKNNISSKFPNFSFQIADIYNKEYNPNGKFEASTYRFPYQDSSFDFVFLTSVFTHMLPRDMEHYFSEISRVLKKNGKCFITYFLSREDSLRLMKTEKSSLNFKHEFEGFRTINLDKSEAAVCYDEAYVLDLYEKYGFKVVRPLHYGSWCGRQNYLSYQDIIIASKSS